MGALTTNSVYLNTMLADSSYKANTLPNLLDMLLWRFAQAHTAQTLDSKNPRICCAELESELCAQKSEDGPNPRFAHNIYMYIHKWQELFTIVVSGMATHCTSVPTSTNPAVLHHHCLWASYSPVHVSVWGIFPTRAVMSYCLAHH